jgi:uncharacterized protein (DUF58 family)
VTRAERRPLRATPLVGALVRTYEERLTQRGQYLLWASVALAVLGLDTRRSQAYVLFSACAAALAMAFLFTRFRRPAVAISCLLPERATAGRALRVPARLRSLSGRAVSDVRFAIPHPVRWSRSLRFRPRELLLDVPAQGDAEASLELLPLRRGRYLLQGATARRTDPLGLATGREAARPEQALLVYPRFWTLTDFMLPVGRRYQPGGIPLSSSIGDAIEFVSTREYRPGDPLRTIHWRSWARRGTPVVKEYQEEYFCRIALVLDTFSPKRPSPDQVRGFEAAVSVVASIADSFSRSEYIVDILAAGPELYEVSAGRSLAYLENVLDVLACLEPCRERAFETIGPVLFERLRQITTVVVVLQDWDAPRQDFLRRITALGTAVRVVIVREGESTLDWRAAADEAFEISAMTPTDVERALSEDAGRA